MTDWDYVRKRRDKGARWSEIADDPKTGFAPPGGADPGRSLKTLYLQRRARGKESRTRRAPGEGSASAFGGRRRTGLIVGVVVTIAVVGAIVAFLVYKPPTFPISPYVTACETAEGTAWHYHPLIVINVNGAQQPLPYAPGERADIGYLDQPGYTNSSLYCASGGLHDIHTHDGSGIVHIEFPPELTTQGSPPTLGDFFQVWGERLDSTHVWSFSGTLTATMLNSDTHDRISYSQKPWSMPLYVPAGGPASNAYQIPQSLIFSGQYGNGQSGGTFDGEIVWLNLTGAATAVQPLPMPIVKQSSSPLNSSMAQVPARSGSTIGARSQVQPSSPPSRLDTTPIVVVGPSPGFRIPF